MKNKIMTLSCLFLAGLMLCGNAKLVKAEEVAAETKQAVEEGILETGTEGIIPEEEVFEEDTEEIETDEDEVPLSETGDSEEDSKKKSIKAAAKKTERTVKNVKTKETVKTEKNSQDVIKYTDEEFKILVCVTFLEAGNQSYRGKLATANAVINRVLSKNFPNSIKGVIYQKYAGHYQFALCAPGGKLDQAMKTYGKKTGWRADYEKACIKVCKDALAGKLATDGNYKFFRLYYKGIEKWKPDGVKIDDTYYYNY